jgi:PAS domain S-box-containing protein
VSNTAKVDFEDQSLSLAEAEDLLKGVAKAAVPADDVQQLLGEFQGLERLDVVEARYQTLVEQIPAVIFMAFLDEGVSKAYVSPQIETMLGFKQEEWLDDPVRWYRQIHPEDRGRWSLEAAQLFLIGEPLRSMYRVIARDVSVVWFHCHAKMVRSPDGRPWFIHGVGFDISDLKRAEEALQKAHDELEDRVRQRTSELARVNAELAQRAEELSRANADLEQFAYSASHDLQEPIRNVAIFSELLKQEYQGKLDSQGENFLSFVSGGARRMEMLVRDLLAYSRVTKASENEPETVDSTLVLSELLDTLQNVIRETQATIISDPLPAIKIPKVHLQQVFQNLILNALKYRSSTLPQVHISAKRDGASWLFVVNDNGIGIAPEYHETIFGLFQRLHSKDKYPGTGIGLAICKRIVERYGGRIWVESEIGQGATFFFTVPATP